MDRSKYNKIVQRYNNTDDDILFKNISEFIVDGGFNSNEHIAHFMSQICHESNLLTDFVENLNYSANRLLAIFPKYFNNITANQYARKPIKIANRVYANRMENGDEKSGDGWKFRGSSPIQLTGRKGFRLCAAYLKIDLINNSDFAHTIECAIPICNFFWTTNGFNKIIDKLSKDSNDEIINNNVKIVTNIVNGGTNGLNERTLLYKKILKILQTN